MGWHPGSGSTLFSPVLVAAVSHHRFHFGKGCLPCFVSLGFRCCENRYTTTQSQGRSPPTPTGQRFRSFRGPRSFNVIDTFPQGYQGYPNTLGISTQDIADRGQRRFRVRPHGCSFLHGLNLLLEPLQHSSASEWSKRVSACVRNHVLTWGPHAAALRFRGDFSAPRPPLHVGWD